MQTARRGGYSAVWIANDDSFQPDDGHDCAASAAPQPAAWLHSRIAPQRRVQQWRSDGLQPCRVPIRVFRSHRDRLAGVSPKASSLFCARGTSAPTAFGKLPGCCPRNLPNTLVRPRCNAPYRVQPSAPITAGPDFRRRTAYPYVAASIFRQRVCRVGAKVSGARDGRPEHARAEDLAEMVRTLRGG
jgi:hypothetical protein